MKRISWAAIAVAVGIVSFSALSSSPPPARGAGATLVVDDDWMGSATDCDSTKPGDDAYYNIQTAIGAAAWGDTISVCPGIYNRDQANLRDPDTGGPGSDNFNIFVNVKGLTIQGVYASGTPITNYNDVAAFVSPKRNTGGGHTDTIFVQADNVTITGLDVTGWTGVGYENNKTVESVGENLTVKYNKLHGMDGAAALYMYDRHFDSVTETSKVQSYRAE